MVWPIATASPMSTSTRSIMPGSLGFTATRLRGASVPEISSDDSTVPTVAVTIGTSTTAGATAVDSAAACAVEGDSLQPASSNEDDNNTTE